jgi:HlyD family secretion protein
VKKVVIGVSVLIGALLAWVLVGRGGGNGNEYRFVKIERGDLESSVSSTGALQATTTVQVGTQVSGQIAEIFVDFNDRVEKDQLIARIDPTLLQQEVRAAEAALERNQAELDQARRDFERVDRLFRNQVATDSEHSTAQYQLAVAEASFKTAQVNLEKARRNLKYSEIRAPVDGVVLERNVDVGQTVAASLSAPQLFLIAGDLSKMEILASVDESDIGRIHEGQEARFTVQAHPDEYFSGVVRQVRLQSKVQENVVSYTVVVGVENADGRLLPGMTATVEFIVARETNVLKVANAALRFQPTTAMRAALRERRERERDAADGGSARGDSAAAADLAGGEGSRRGSGRNGDDRQGASNRTMLWYLDAGGTVGATPVRTGVSDGQYTVIQGRGIQEGMEVIAAVTTATPSQTTNPFESQRNQGPPGRFRPGM